MSRKKQKATYDNVSDKVELIVSPKVYELVYGKSEKIYTKKELGDKQKEIEADFEKAISELNTNE